MSGELSISKFNFNEITFDVVVVNNGDNENKLYFFGSKVAEALGYRNVRDAVRKHCPRRIRFEDLREERVSFRDSCDESEETRGAKCAPSEENNDLHPHKALIPESDVYRLVMRSKIPEAVEFQDFVCDELLPSLRKFGEYPPPPNITSTSSRKMIGYDVGDHSERMKYFTTLECDCSYSGNFNTIASHCKCGCKEERRELRFQTKTESDLLKSNPHVEVGRKGGVKTQQKWREMKSELEELRKKFDELMRESVS